MLCCSQQKLVMILDSKTQTSKKIQRNATMSQPFVPPGFTVTMVIECKCGEMLGTDKPLKCQVGKNLSIATHYCATYNMENRVIECGKCIYNVNPKGPCITLPSSLSELNETMCGKLFNRTGTLCGKCKDGHYPQAYSFDMSCIQCPNGNTNWWKYILAAYLPLTVFYLLVLAFRINVASSSLLYPFVVCAQGLTFPANSRIVFLNLRNNPMQKTATR